MYFWMMKLKHREFWFTILEGLPGPNPVEDGSSSVFFIIEFFMAALSELVLSIFLRLGRVKEAGAVLFESSLNSVAFLLFYSLTGTSLVF